jgi:hypothetical protein
MWCTVTVMATRGARSRPRPHVVHGHGHGHTRCTIELHAKSYFTHFVSLFDADEHATTHFIVWLKIPMLESTLLWPLQHATQLTRSLCTTHVAKWNTRRACAYDYFTATHGRTLHCATSAAVSTRWLALCLPSSAKKCGAWLMVQASRTISLSLRHCEMDGFRRTPPLLTQGTRLSMSWLGLRTATMPETGARACVHQVMLLAGVCLLDRQKTTHGTRRDTTCCSSDTKV